MVTITAEDTDTVMKSMVEYIKNYYAVHNKSPTQLEDHPFSRKNVERYFGIWSNLLIAANIPLNRNKIYYLKCKECKKSITKQYKEYIKTKNDFCSHKCAAKFNNTGRKQSQETREKIRQKLIIIRFTKCIICKIEFKYQKRKRATCGDKCLSELKRLNNDIKYGRIIPE